METLTPSNLAEYEQFVRSNPKGHFAQSTNWAKVKSAWQGDAVIVRDTEGNICGTMALLARKLPGLPYSICYSCRGPVCDIHDTATLTRLVADAKALAKQKKAYVLKVDPDVSITDTAFIEDLNKLGFVTKPPNKNFEGIQPRFVFRLDISDKTEEDLMNFFQSKTRYNIRLAQRKGVTTKIAGREELADFHRIMVETGVRDDFVTRPLAYFQKMYDALGEDVRLYMAYLDGVPVAGTLAIHYGDKVWYLYGASSNEHRNVMPNYLLQWEMIRWAVETGCRIYDFRGVSGDLDESNPLYGLYRFKRGFNGDFTEFVGEYDLILNPFIYTLVERGEKFYKKGIRMLYRLKYGKKS